MKRRALILCIIASGILAVVLIYSNFFAKPQMLDSRISREYLERKFPEGTQFSLIEEELKGSGYVMRDCLFKAKQNAKEGVTETCFDMDLFSSNLLDSIKVSHRNGKIVAISDGGSYDLRLINRVVKQ